MSDNEWIVYNHALIPKIPPHVAPNTNNLSQLLSKSSAYFARYTTNFDCGYETEWWYCIKDNDINLDALNSKRRYVVKSGIHNFEVRIIDPVQYSVRIYDITREGFRGRGKEASFEIERGSFIESVVSWRGMDCFGAFDRRTGELSGYALCVVLGDCANLNAVRTLPESEKKNIHAAIVNGVCQYYLNGKKARYLSDGERNIRHVTGYQDYLIKYFGFRKAYCVLNVKYKTFVNIIISMLYPFRGLFAICSANLFVYNIYCTLKQEQIHRSFKSLEGL